MRNVREQSQTLKYIDNPMPTISKFLGMVITMYVSEHPPPHFHVRHGEMRAVFDIQTGELLKG